VKIAIIGCGIVGAAIAYELSLVKGLDITLIDQKAPASGSTNAALGILFGVVSRKTKGRAWRLREASMQRYPTLISELEAIIGKAIPHNSQGIVMLRFAGEDTSKWEKLISLRHSQGWNLELWDREQLQSKCPQVENDQVIGAVYSPQDLQVNPIALTQALVTAAEINGVTCRWGVKVANFSTQGTRCVQLQTSEGNLPLDWLVVAAGLGSTPLTASLAQPLDIRPVLGQAMRVKLNQPLGNLYFQPVIGGDDVHIVPLGNQEYWLGATLEFADEMGEIKADETLFKQFKERGIAFCPGLADATILNTWSGTRPRPEGMSAPVIGNLPGYDNVLLATGHYRNGVLLAPATALAIKDLILD
jgi:glycine/D-amino acid oxidase-like deaminating enzyme